MVTNRLLLGSVAFGVSFGLSLLMSHDTKRAFLTGLITLPATLASIAVVNYRQKRQHKLALNALESQIYQLERWETQLNQSLLVLATEKQRTEVNVNFLKTELSQLYTQIAEQRSHKQQLTQDSTALKEHKSHLEENLHDLQTQIQNCEQRRRELYQYLRSMKDEKQNIEAAFTSVQDEFKHLCVQVTERENQKQELERDLVVVKQLRPPLEEELHVLQTEIQELEKQKTKLKQSLSVINQEKNLAKVELDLLESKSNRLQAQILEQQTIKDKLDQGTIRVEQERPLEPEPNQAEKLFDEWTQFSIQLTDIDLQILRAIIDQSDPNYIIKKIAEENITMPELLLDSINERALDTIGDLIIDPGNGFSNPPKIVEEYSVSVNKLLKINYMN